MQAHGFVDDAVQVLSMLQSRKVGDGFKAIQFVLQFTQLLGMAR